MDHDDLLDAVERGDVEQARALLEAGADPHHDSWGLPLIDAAVDRRDLDMARLLVEHGVDVGAVDTDGRNRLHHAASASDDPGPVGFLLRLGLDPNAVDRHGWTPLHCAATYGYAHVFDVLLDAGADPATVTTVGLSPAAILQKNGHPANGRMTERGSTPYFKFFQALRGVYLEGSWVLEIMPAERSCVFRLEAALTPEHPAYRPARNGEQHCASPAILRLTSVTAIQFRSSGATPAVDATGETDLGNIDSFESLREDGLAVWALAGDWGELLISNPTVEFSLGR